MGFEREEVSFLNLSLGETIGTNFLRGNVGDVITATISIRFDGDYVLATSLLADDPDGLVSLIVFPDDTTTDGVIPDVRHLWTGNIIGFENVKEGDEITIKNPAGVVTHVKTVIEKIDSQLLLMDTTWGSTGQSSLPVGTIAYVSTPMRSIEYSFGLIENSEPVNFLSKIDGNEQKSTAQGLSSTTLSDTAMVPSGSKSNQYGGLKIKGNGIGDGPTDPTVSQAFIITHTFIINPLSLASQNTDIKNDVAPVYLRDSNSLKYVFEAELSNDLTDPNRKKELIYFEALGNCGFLDSNFNTGITNYSISDVVYTRLSGETSSELEITTDQTMLEFFINSTVSAFSSGNTRLVMNHWFMPTPEEEYREPQFSNGVNLAKDRNIKENFLLDRVECTLDDVTTNDPDNLGTDQQIFTSALVGFVSTVKAKATVLFGMSPEALSRVIATSGRDYLLSIAVKNHALIGSFSDNATLKIDALSYFTDLTDPSMIQTDITFVDHPNSDPDAGTSTLTVRTEDDVVGIAKFVLDRNDITGFTRQGVEIGFANITAQVIARKDANTFFVLDSFDRNLPANRNKIIAPYGTVPTIGLAEDRGFRTPADDLRKNLVVKRRTDLDAGGFFHYELYFPFIFRWEYWAALEDVNDEFYDESLPNNGLNHDWARYAARAGWNIFFQFTIVATKDGVALDPFVTESQLFVEDYTEGTEWGSEDIKGYLVSTGDEITEGGQSGISLDEATRIEGEMTYITTPLPTLPDLVMVLMVNVFEKGDFKAQYRISSLYPNTTTNNVWVGLAGALTATKDDSLSPKFIVKAELRPELLEEEQEFRFSCRFHDTRPDLGVPDGKTLAQGGLKTSIIGMIKEIV